MSRPFIFEPTTYRVFPSVFVELLLGLAREGALGTGVRPLATVVHLVLFQLPFRPEDLLADSALLRVFRIVDLQVEPQRPQFLEALLALRTLEHAVHRCVNLEINGEIFAQHYFPSKTEPIENVKLTVQH